MQFIENFHQNCPTTSFRIFQECFWHFSKSFLLNFPKFLFIILHKFLRNSLKTYFELKQTLTPVYSSNYQNILFWILQKCPSESSKNVSSEISINFNDIFTSKFSKKMSLVYLKNSLQSSPKCNFGVLQLFHLEFYQNSLRNSARTFDGVRRKFRSGFSRNSLQISIRFSIGFVISNEFS